jgi:thioredoxin 1
VRLAKVYVRIGQLGAARRILDHLSDSSLSSDVLKEVNAAEILLEKLSLNDRWKEADAIEDIQRFLELCPHSLEANSMYVQHLMQNFDLDEALQVAFHMQNYKHNPEAVAVSQRYVGLVYYQQGAFGKALVAMHEALRRNPDDQDLVVKVKVCSKLDTLKNRGNELFKHEKLQEAYDAYSECLLLDPKHPVILSNRAAVCSKMERYSAAMEDVEKALSMYPNYAKALLRRGYLLTKMGDFAGAIRDYEKAGGPDKEENVRAVRIEERKSLGQTWDDLLPKPALLHIDSEEEFDKMLTDAGNRVVIVDFFATWCGPCKMIAPQFQSMSDQPQYQGKAVFAKVDVDKVAEIAARYSIRSMPTFLLLKNFKVVDTVVGADINSLRASISKHAGV